MRKAIKTYSTSIFLSIFLVFSLTSCGKAAVQNTSIGVFAAATGTAAIGIEQKGGYDLGLKDAKFKFSSLDIDETAPSSDTQRTIRSLAEDSTAPILAMLGAASNDATARAASLANFFNLPLVVPSANGDNIFPSNNLWAFRLSASGSDYANFIFGKILTRANAGSDAQTLIPFQGLKIAILYEENTFGESAAVATAQAAMLQMINIGLYANFPASNPDVNQLAKLIDQIKAKNIQVVYLISNNPATATTLVQALQTGITNPSTPVIIGQAGGFASQDFLSSKTAEGVFVLRQQLSLNGCPADIHSLYQAQSYASIALMDQAVQQTQSILPTPVPWYFIQQQSPVSQISAYREKIRDTLKENTFQLPCLGSTAFDNLGQNKLLHLEIISVDQGKVVTSQLDAFTNALVRRIAQDLLQ